MHYSSAVTKKSELGYPIPNRTSNFKSNSHTGNITGREANSTSTSQEKLSRGITSGAIISPSADVYKVTVTFDSLTVHDNHEGLFSGDGEYNLFAYVQGKKIGLTDASYTTDLCAGWSCTGAPALLDVREGETVYFNPGTEVTVELPRTMPLSIFTAGDEIDDCERQEWIDPDLISLDPQFPGLTLADVFKNPQLDWLSAVRLFIIYAQAFADCISLDSNDPLGNVVKFYNPPGQSYEPIGWGAGSHTNVVSDTGDYTLRYTITIAPKVPAKQINPSMLSNKFQSNNTFSFKNPN